MTVALKKIRDLHKIRWESINQMLIYTLFLCTTKKITGICEVMTIYVLKRLALESAREMN